MTDWLTGADAWAKVLAIVAGAVAVVLAPLAGFLQQVQSFRVQRAAVTPATSVTPTLSVAGPIMMHDDAAKLATAQERTAIAAEEIRDLIRDHLAAEESEHKMAEVLRRLLEEERQREGERHPRR